MLEKLVTVRTLMFSAIAALGFSVTGCDFGNKTDSTHETEAQEGTIQEGDNQDDYTDSAADTAELDTFR